MVHFSKALCKFFATDEAVYEAAERLFSLTSFRHVLVRMATIQNDEDGPANVVVAGTVFSSEAEATEFLLALKALLDAVEAEHE